ncbi:MAG: outer membrane lipoprotein-sorting protein [Sedimentisphaerales bacterium]|nr:outer membrane lipoprotein-sorting protein [Sedimentisphaerales bacterium]
MESIVRYPMVAALAAAMALSLLCGIPALGQDEGGTPSARAGETPATPFIKDGKVDVNAVVDHFENLYRADSSISTAQLTVTKPNRTKTMTLKSWTHGEEKALIVIQSPPREEGIATLMVEDNLWNYFPRIDRTIRIPPSMMQSSWMGTDFTNDDLVRETSFKEDYTYELVERTADPNGWLVRFIAKPATVGVWERFDLIVTPDARLPIEAKYFDRRDRHARTLYWDQVKVFDGRRIPSHMTLIPQDEDKEGHKTEMDYLDIDFNADVPERMFSLSELEQKH